MKWLPLPAIVLGLLSSSWTAPDVPVSRPNWVGQYLQKPPAAWDGWRNSLRPGAEAAPPITLATEGDTDYVIVTPASATRLEKRAAKELQLWLGEITGAQFSIVPDTTPPGEYELSVGNTRRLAEANLASIDPLGPEGYRIAVEGQRVYLLGGAHTGPLPAALALLEEDLGVRWYVPAIPNGSWSELSDALNAERWPVGTAAAPKRPTLAAAIVPRVSEPPVPVRCLSWRRSYNPWAVRNRVNGGYAHQWGQHGYVDGGFFCHTFHRLVPPDTYFEEHPEYYSLIDGQRRCKNAQLCLSNPEVAAVAAQTAAEMLRRVPASQRAARRLLDVSQEDCLGDCQCADCRAAADRLGGYAGLQLDFVNRIADLLKDEFPWVTLTTLAYRQSKNPPTGDIRARHNVAVRFCTDFGASFNWPYHSFYDAKIAQHRQMFERWRQVSPRMHLWIYPHQYRHYLAPMPSIRAVAENIRFFHDQGAESIYIQQSIGADRGREPMRYWVFAKLLCDPTLDVEELIRDFIWGVYGAAAPAVYDYEQLLWEQSANYTDFGRMRDWIYAIHDEGMYSHDFVQKARDVLDRALDLADNDDIRRRVELLKVGVVYVESVQLYMQMRDGMAPPQVQRYAAIIDELSAMLKRLDLSSVGFYDGSRTISGADEWITEMRTVWARRYDQRFLPAEEWGPWAFRWDLEDKGVREEWFRHEATDEEGWTSVPVPAFLADTPAGNEIGFGWYRVTFTLPAEHAHKPIDLEFDGVDEQAWVYVNGKSVGEHTLQSEFMVGQQITVVDLWNRPFTRTVEPELLKTGENLLVVRIHNSAMNAGIHQPVRVYLPEARFSDLCDGAALHETFANIDSGGIPVGWQRYVQGRDGHLFGCAEVSHQFVRTPTLHLRDERSHVAVWSTSDEVVPPGGQWAVQFDFRLTGGLAYKADDCGAIFGLKRGDRRNGDFLPLLQLDNGEAAGKPVTLLGLGEVLATDLPADRWHRVVIHRDAAQWQFYLDDELKKTVANRDTDCRGIALGSFRDWRHVARDIHYADLKIGAFTGPARAQ